MSDRFEHKLREKASNFEVPFNEADWDKMNLMLEADSGKKSVSWLRRFLLLSIVANLVFLTWFSYHKLTETNQADLVQSTEQNARLSSSDHSNNFKSNKLESPFESTNANSSNLPKSLNSSRNSISSTDNSLENGGLLNQLRAKNSENAASTRTSSQTKKPRSNSASTWTTASNNTLLSAESLSSFDVKSNAFSNSFLAENTSILASNTSKSHTFSTIAELPFKSVELRLNKNATSQRAIKAQKVSKLPKKRSNGWFVEAGIGSLKSSILATGSAWYISAGKGFYLTSGFDMYAGIQFSSQHSTRIFSQNPPATTLLAASYDPNLPNFGIFQQVSTHNQRIGIQTFFERSRRFNPGYFKPFVGVNLNFLTASKIEALQYSASHELEYSNVADFNRDLKGTVKSNENPISTAERFNVSLTGGFAKEWEMKKIMEKFRLATYVTYTPTNKKSPVNIPFQWGISAGFRL